MEQDIEYIRTPQYGTCYNCGRIHNQARGDGHFVMICESCERMDEVGQ